MNNMKLYITNNIQEAEYCFQSLEDFNAFKKGFSRYNQGGYIPNLIAIRGKYLQKYSPCQNNPQKDGLYIIFAGNLFRISRKDKEVANLRKGQRMGKDAELEVIEKAGELSRFLEIVYL